MEHSSHFILVLAPIVVLLTAYVLQKRQLKVLQILSVSVVVFFALFHLAPTYAFSSHSAGHGIHSVADHPCCMPQTPSLAPLTDLFSAPTHIASVNPSSDHHIGFLSPKTFTTRSPPGIS